MLLGILFLFVFYHALFSFPLPLFFFSISSLRASWHLFRTKGEGIGGERGRRQKKEIERKKTTNEEINDACVRPSLENGENKGEMHETGEATGKEEKRTDRSLRGTLHCRKK